MGMEGLSVARNSIIRYRLAAVSGLKQSILIVHCKINNFIKTFLDYFGFNKLKSCSINARMPISLQH